MSCCDRHGRQLQPSELTVSDAWAVARSIIHDERMPKAERLRLMGAVLDTDRFGLADGDQ